MASKMGKVKDEIGNYYSVKSTETAIYDENKLRLDHKLKYLNQETLGYGVISGLEVTAQSTPNMTVNISTGIVYMPSGIRYTPSAIVGLAITTANATNPRKDIIYVNSSGVISYLAGTASATPTAPSLPSDGILLAEIYVGAGATTITSSNIIDNRIIIKSNTDLVVSINEVNTKIKNNMITNVKDYGAKGDGTTDDTTAIQNAINDVQIKGGIIYVPSGKYKLTSTLTISGDGSVILQGVNSSSFQINHDNIGLNVTTNAITRINNLSFTNSGNGITVKMYGENIEMKDCYFIGSETSSANIIETYGANDSIQDCRFIINHQNAFCILVSAIQSKLNINSLIAGNEFYGIGNGLVIDTNATDVRPEGLNITNNKFITTGGDSLLINAGLGILIDGNIIDQSSAYSIRINNTAQEITDLVITNNPYISSASNKINGSGILCVDNTQYVNNLIISGNIFSDCGYGVYLGSKVRNLILNGNVMTNNAQTGITILSTGKIIISNNMIHDCVTSIVAKDENSGRFIITGNFFSPAYIYTITTPANWINEHNFYN